MRFVGRGHPAVRATHTKTLELTPDTDLTERGTCVVAVAAVASPAQPIAGPVRIRITAGGARATVHAVANPSWNPDGPIVIRRSPMRLPGTFATESDTAAADLPRELVTALTDPEALVTVDVLSVAEEATTTVLLAADPTRTADAALQAEWDVAGTVDRQDPGARRIVAAKDGDGRRLVVATAGLPRLSESAARVEVVGLPTLLAAAAATVAGAPLVFAEATDLREVLRQLPASSRLATTVPSSQLESLLADAQNTRRSSACRTAQACGPIQSADADHLPTLYDRDPVSVCFEAATGEDALDPDVRAAIAGLLADGVPTKTTAAALARLTGQSRRTAYDTVLALDDRRGES